MTHEVNIDSIRALEERIEESKEEIIELKRARNSLLNVSTRVPSEILGQIFAWSLVRRGGPNPHRGSHFDGFHKGSYNFLLVCRRWFEVASRTPELWSFWGNTLREWRERYHHPGVGPLDLVLDGCAYDPDPYLSGRLRDTLKDCAMQDTVRSVHLLNNNGDLLTSIVALLTPDDEGVWSSSIESIDLRNRGVSVMDVSNFFVRNRLPKLRSLFLHGVLIMPSWDHLVPQTTLLTCLSLEISESSSTLPPTTPQLFSILVSNPGLQLLSLADSAIPEDDGDGSTSRVPLHHLKALRLQGESRHVFGLLRRLAFPNALTTMALTAYNSTVEGASQILRQYLQGYFRRDHGPRDRLEMKAHSTRNQLLLRVNTLVEPPGRLPLLVLLQVSLAREAPPSILENLCLNLITLTPRARVYHFDTSLPPNRLEDQLIEMPNIETLTLFDVTLYRRFLQPNPRGPRTRTKLLPSLRSLCLEKVSLTNHDWGDLTTYLAHQTSGGQGISLKIAGDFPHLCVDMAKEVESMVEKFQCHLYPVPECLFSRCEGGVGEPEWLDDVE